MENQSNLIEDSLGVVVVQTKWDSLDRTREVVNQLKQTVPTCEVVVVDGDQCKNLSDCLNHGIRFLGAKRCQYVHWLHNDFSYNDPQWFLKLKTILFQDPSILKICASNSRDPIGPFRIGQEQSWLMRMEDFLRFPWLWFDSRFVKCGGMEDWMQSLHILGRGGIVAITPETAIYHVGAQTRSKYDTNPDQLYNQWLYGALTGIGQAFDPHDAKFFGCFLTANERNQALASLSEKCMELIPKGIRGVDLSAVRDKTWPLILS